MELTPLLNKLKIVDKSAHLTDLQLNWAQQLLLEEWQRQVKAGKPVRIIVLKARQIGISTVVDAILFCYAFMYNHLRGLIVSHENKSNEHLLGIVNTYWDTFLFQLLFTPKQASRIARSWDETKSAITVQTAKNVKGGRSMTIHFLHASEVGFWDKPGELMTGLRQAIPDSPETAIALESTANGIGNYFNREWNSAMAGDSEYVPLFFPWWMHPEYRRDGDPLEYLDSEERKLVKLIKAGLEIGNLFFQILDEEEINAALLWRRWAINNLFTKEIKEGKAPIDLFHQEYPSTPEEAFLSTGTNVFPLGDLKYCFDRQEGQPGRLIKDERDWRTVRFVPDTNGPLRVYKKPSDNVDFGVYVIGGDPTRTTRGDYACMQVINRRSLEQVAVWRGRCDPATFAYEMAKLGYYFNTALVAPETEGPGYNTIGVLQGLNYPSIWQHERPDKLPGKVSNIYGWSTTHQSKHLAIGWLIKVIVDHSVTIHDPLTFSEMRDYVTLDNGGYGNGNDSDYDDTVMAMAIGVTCHMMEPVLPVAGGPANVEDIEEIIEGDVPPWENWGAEN